MKKIFTALSIAACFLTACNSKASLTVTTDSTAIKAEQNRLTALKATMDLSDRNVDPMFVMCSANFIDYGSGEEKPMTNLDTIKAGLKAYVAAFPDLKGTDINAFAHGDSVVVIGTWSGTFKGDFMGIKATNKSFKYTDADIFTFTKDGKMASHRSVQSSALFFKQLGIGAEPKK
jgi:predicted ester cyclase